MSKVDENRNAAQSARSQSLQLALESLCHLEDRPDLSLLLSVEAYRIHSSFDTQSALLTALQRRPSLIVMLHGPRSGVNSVAYNPDGNTVAAACGSMYSDNDDNVVYLWDVTTGQLLATLQGHQSPVLSVVFSPNGTRLASGAADGTILLWNVSARRQIATLNGHTMAVGALAFSPDGVMLASGGGASVDVERTCDQGGLRLWNVLTHKPLGGMLTGHTSAITGLAFAPDGKTLASGSGGAMRWFTGDDYTVLLWDVAERSPIELPSPSNEDPLQDRSIRSLAFHPDGTLLAAGTACEPVVLWDVERRVLLPVPTLHNRAQGSGLTVQFSADGSQLQVADAVNRVTVMEYEIYINRLTNQPAVAIRDIQSYGEEHTVQSIAFSPDGTRRASGGCGKRSSSGTCIEGEVGIWSAVEHHSVATAISGKFWWANTVAFSPDGKLLAASVGKDPDSNNEIRFWNLKTGKWLRKRIPSQRARPLMFGPDGKWLASGEGNTIRVLDAVTHEPVVAPLVYNVLVHNFAFTPVGTLFAVVGEREIMVRDLHGRRSFSLPLARPGVNVGCLAFSPDGKLLVAGSCSRKGEKRSQYEWRRNGCLEGAITFWDVEAGEMSGQPLAAHTTAVSAVAFSPDGKILATASDKFEGAILLWDVATRTRIGRPLVGHNGGITKLCFRPDGHTLVSIAEHYGIESCSLILWDVATQRAIGRPLETHALERDMTLSADGRRLASSGISGTIFVWDLDPADWIVRAGRIVNRNLTPAEWELYFGDEPYRKTFLELP